MSAVGSTTRVDGDHERPTDSTKRKAIDESHSEHPKRTNPEYPKPTGMPVGSSNHRLETLPTPLASPQVTQAFAMGSSHHPKNHDTSPFEPAFDPLLRQKRLQTHSTVPVAHPMIASAPVATSAIESSSKLPEPEVINVDSEDDEPSGEEQAMAEETQATPVEPNYEGLMRFGDRSLFTPTSPRSVRVTLSSPKP